MTAWSGATCRSCGEPILWARTESGKRMPVDRDPVLNGNLTLLSPRGQLTAYVVHPNVLIKNYVSHFATCPNSKEHRKAKAVEKAADEVIERRADVLRELADEPGGGM